MNRTAGYALQPIKMIDPKIVGLFTDAVLV